MSNVLNSIIATAFNSANQAGADPASRFVNARQGREQLDSMNALRDTQTQASQMALEDERATRDLMGQLHAIREKQAALPQAQSEAINNFMGGVERGTINPDLAERAVQMLQQPGVELSQEQDRLINQLAQVNPSVRDAYISALFPQEQGPQTNIGKLIAERDSLPEGDPRRAIYDDAIAEATQQDPGVNVTTNVDTGKAESAGVKKAAEVAATRLDEGDQEVQKAHNMLGVISTAKQQLNQGIIAGTGADLRQNFATLLSTIGIGDGTAENTQTYIAATAGLVADVIKQFGSGSGLSDADREFAKIMAGASTNLTPAALARILDINARAQLAKIQSFNDTRGRVAEKFPTLGGLYQDYALPEFELEPSPVESYDTDGMNPRDVAELEALLLGVE